jgi:hypothetical protein
MVSVSNETGKATESGTDLILQKNDIFGGVIKKRMNKFFKD